MAEVRANDELGSGEGYNDGFGSNVVKAQYLKEPLAVGSTNDAANRPMGE
jgi:hypothetical protein